MVICSLLRYVPAAEGFLSKAMKYLCKKMTSVLRPSDVFIGKLAVGLSKDWYCMYIP